MKVLIAEDEIYSAMALQQLLETQGHEVKVAYDGNQAWAMYQKGGFQLGILDADMPGLNGYELAQHIRDHEKKSGLRPILLIHFSGYSLPEDEVEKKGFDGQIQKPIYEPEALFKFINKVILARS